MPSYLKFRDVSAAIVAGQHLAAAGDSLNSTVQRVTDQIGSLEKRVLRGTDHYSQEFLREYEAPAETAEGSSTFNVALRANSRLVADRAVKIGENVVEAAQKYLWVDAVNGAAMFRSAQGG
jgi:hypothetical protein